MLRTGGKVRWLVSFEGVSTGKHQGVLEQVQTEGIQDVEADQRDKDGEYGVGLSHEAFYVGSHLGETQKGFATCGVLWGRFVSFGARGITREERFVLCPRT